MILLPEAFEIARKEFGPRVLLRVLESKEYWIFGCDWDAMKIKRPTPGVGPLIVRKDNGQIEYPPIPPKMTPQMREIFKSATVVHYPA